MQQDDAGSEIENLGTTHPTMATAVVMEMTTFSKDVPVAFRTTEVMPPDAPFSESLPVAVAVPGVLSTTSMRTCVDESLHTKEPDSVQQPK